MKKPEDIKILIADDTEENIDLLMEALGDTYDVLVATNGETTIEIAESELPDLIILDIIMPDLNGFEVNMHLKNNKATRKIPVIYLSSRDDGVSKKKAFETGAIDYLTKPIDIMDVRARVNHHLKNIAKNKAMYERTKRIETALMERTEQLNLTKEAAINALVFMSENRNKQNMQHIRRVKDYFSTLAKVLQQNPKFENVLSDEIIEKYLEVVPLYDIGLICVSDDILTKTTKLEDHEYELIKMHTLRGWDGLTIDNELVRNNMFLKYSVELARHHHENWDGSGYPDRLKGEAIPIGARVMSIADVYDALVHDRPYRKSISHLKAVDIIVEGSGIQFDPDLVSAFIKCNESFKTIAESFADE